MEPAHTAGKDGLPVEVARFELCGGLVGAIVEYHRGTHPLAAVAVNGCHVGTIDTVVFELLIERTNTHRPHPLGDQVTDRIIHHGGDDACIHAETVREVRGAVELSAADVDLILAGLAEGDYSRVKPVHQRAQGDKIQCAILGNIKPVLHEPLS